MKFFFSFKITVYGFLLVLALLGFSSVDIDITSIHGLAFLDAVKSGKVLQFYSFAIPYHEVPPVYDIVYYAIFGIWQLPIWLSGLILDQPVPVWLRIVWCKILLALLFFIACSLTSRMIGNVTSGDEAEEYRQWMPLSFFAVFTIFMMGQYDIIYLVIMLYAFVLMIEKRLTAAALLFGVSALFKYFPLFVAVPAFLLVEKRKSRLIQYFGLCILPIILGKIPFMFDTAPAVVEIRKAFFKGMFGHLFAPEIVLGSGKVALFIILYISICFGVYACSCREEKVLKERILYLPLLTFCMLFLCILWHGWWMLLLVPFIPMAAAWNPRFKVEIHYASLLVFGALLVHLSAFQAECWFRYSPVSLLLPHMEALPEEAKYTFTSLLTHYELVPVLVQSVIAAGLILLAVFAWPGWKKENPLPGKKLFRWELWLGFCIIPVMVLIFISLHLLSVRSEQKLFRSGSSALNYYRPSWKKEEESFTNRVVVNAIHLKQKQFSAPLCLVPRFPVKFLHDPPSADPLRYVLSLPSWNGIRAKLKAIHLVLDAPMKNSSRIILSASNGTSVSSERVDRIPNQHIVLMVKSDLVPTAISLVSNSEIPDLKEYYLEFDEKAGGK